ncbi:MAG TPA: hypothetical protein VK348_12780 [Planctomycetota bacterium]|nr:hypothetical protein [Planctomycetota bacterium]
MGKLGFLLLVLGAGSCVMSFMNYESRLLTWINNWGEQVAWCIRGGLVVLGLLLMMVGKQKPKGD